ncbi:hypothetical protein E2562_005823 [Oryza meyeriana var. granulata]|uniref:Auxin-responsive protein n=1 Tax=Oryza meyeriana var. granulata TaxID=110450 RepID=A0A6G1CDJ6_9ORYZ|nr:hypothetical protein E2562_005823 [Oryza meyeriana var. granulata]
MKSSSVAPRLKQEKQDDCKFQEGDLNSLELRLGISSDNGQSGGGASPWLGVGVHPWSLAARQGKAALEQAHQRPNECAVQRENRPAASAQLVGWPPVRAFRKNLTTPKPADAEDLMSKVKLCSDECHGSGDATQERRPSSTMFVKVNLEGYAVGRKIDLKAQRSYDSLSQALQSMFHGFLSDGIATRDDEQHQQLEKGTKKRYVLVYEDNEGDRMLVGDVPWEYVCLRNLSFLTFSFSSNEEDDMQNLQLN